MLNAIESPQVSLAASSTREVRPTASPEPAGGEISIQSQVRTLSEARLAGQEMARGWQSLLADAPQPQAGPSSAPAPVTAPAPVVFAPGSIAAPVASNRFSAMAWAAASMATADAPVAQETRRVQALSAQSEARQFGFESQEVTSIVSSRNAEFGALPPTGEVRSWSEAVSVVRGIEERFPNLTSEQIVIAARMSQYSDIGGRNQMPVHDFLLGGDRSNPELVAAALMFKQHLPEVVSGPNGDPVAIGHAFTGLNGMNNGNPAAALVMTHLGDFGQVLGGGVAEGAQLVGTAVLAGLDVLGGLLPGNNFQESLERAGGALSEQWNNFTSVTGFASADQLAGNNMGFGLFVDMLGGKSLSEALAGLTPPSEGSQADQTQVIVVTGQRMTEEERLTYDNLVASSPLNDVDAPDSGWDGDLDSFDGGGFDGGFGGGGGGGDLNFEVEFN